MMTRRRPPSRPETVATRWVRELVENQRTAAIRARVIPDGDTIRQTVAKQVRDDLAGSDMQARDRASVISAIAVLQYITACAGDILRSARIPGAVTWHGQIAVGDVPARSSVPARDANGARIKKPGTYPMWLSLPRDQYLAKLADIDLAYDQDGLRRALWHKGAAMLQKHPKATNVIEACKLDGVSVAAFLAAP
jgi:hypothetical protein